MTSYGYDSLSRLTSEVEKNSDGGASASWGQGYDLAGNRNSKTMAGNTKGDPGTTTYQYNGVNHLISRNNDITGCSKVNPSEGSIC